MSLPMVFFLVSFLFLFNSLNSCDTRGLQEVGRLQTALLHMGDGKAHPLPPPRTAQGDLCAEFSIRHVVRTRGKKGAAALTWGKLGLSPLLRSNPKKKCGW